MLTINMTIPPLTMISTRDMGIPQLKHLHPLRLQLGLAIWVHGHLIFVSIILAPETHHAKLFSDTGWAMLQ